MAIDQSYGNFGFDPSPAAPLMRSRRSLRRLKSGRGSKDVGSDSCNGSWRTTEFGDDPRPQKSWIHGGWAKVPETTYIYMIMCIYVYICIYIYVYIYIIISFINKCGYTPHWQFFKMEYDDKAWDYADKK